MKINILKYIILLSIFSSISFSDIETYSKVLHKLDYNKSSKEMQKKLDLEYENHEKLFKIIKKNQLNNNEDLKTKVEIATVKIWLNEFKKNYKPSNSELEAIYLKLNPKLSKEYKLSIIKVQYEASYKKILKMFSGNEAPKEKYEKFQDFVHKFTIDVKTKKDKGKLGWIKEKNLRPSVKKALEPSEKNDIVVAFIEDDGWQILYVEDILPVRPASFDQAKDLVIKVAKNNALKREINKLVK